MTQSFEITIGREKARIVPELPESIVASLNGRIQTCKAVENGTQVLAGLVPRVVRQLQNLGYRVRLRNQAVWPELRKADKQVLDDPRLPLRARELVQAITTHPRGQIAVGGLEQASKVLALICTVFSEARIFVVVLNRKTATDLADRVRQKTNRPIETDHNRIWTVNNRVYVGTAALFSSANYHDWDLVVFVDPRTVTAKQSLGNAIKLGDKLLYCLRGRNVRLDDFQELRLEAICGDEIYRYSRKVKRPDVHVLLANTPSVPINMDGMGALERKRLAIWGNDLRNDVIAEIARGFTSGSSDDLWKHGLLLDAQQDWFDEQGGGLRTVVLVESPEHGRQLIQRLSGWELLSFDPEQYLTDERGVRELPASVNQQVVATMAYAEQWGVDTDVLIYAMGINHPWSSKWEPLTWEERGLIVVDFRDDSDERVRNEVQSRIREHQHAGRAVDTVRNDALTTGRKEVKMQ